ncbi:hypothetical protein C8Q80DRAFT_1181105 [Daedaleopsis nitida]|nr:hypothetical protein C8Q80DRAFT_1181105 [Daedaleopsis nitida]
MLLATTGVVIYNVVDAFLNKRPGSTILVVLSISLCLDIALTIKLVLYLRRSRTGIRSTDNIINRLVSFSINTGLLTGILTICPIIVLATTPVHLGYYPVSASLAPVHTSVVLAAVNSRRSLVDRGSQGVELHSFDLDIAPRPEHRTRDNTSIHFATRSSSPTSDPVARRFSVGPAPEVQIRLGRMDDDEDARSVNKSEAHAV